MSRGGGSARGVRAGRAYVELGVNDRLTRGLNAASAQMQAFGRRIAAIGAGVTAAGATVVGSIAVASRQFANFGDEIAKASRRSGIAADALSELAVAADLSGSSMQDLVLASMNVDRQIQAAADGSVAATRAIERLGFTVGQLAGMNAEERISAIADALVNMGGDGQATAAAMELLGRQGRSLIPMLLSGADGISSMRAEARRLALTMDAETAKKAEDLKDAFTLLRRVVQRITIEIGSKFAKPMTLAAGAMATLGAQVVRFISANGQLVRRIAITGVSIMAVGTVLTAFGAAAIGVGIALKVAAIAFGAVMAAGAILLPILLKITVTIAAVGAAFWMLYRSSETVSNGVAHAISWLGDRFGDLFSRVNTVISSIVSALARGDIESALAVVGASMEVVWSTALNAIGGGWEGLKSKLLASSVRLMSGLAQVFASGFSILEDLSNKFATTWLSVWARIRGAVRERFASAQLGDEIIAIRELGEAAGKSQDEINAAIMDAERRHARRISSIRQDETRDMQAIAGQRDQFLRDLQERFESRIADILKAEEALVAAAMEGGQSEIDAARARLDEAKKKLDEALKTERARQGESGPSPFERLRQSVARFSDDFQQMSNAMSRVQVAGTFSGQAARMFGGGTQQVATRTALATERTARNTERLVEEVRNGGTFGP